MSVLDLSTLKIEDRARAKNEVFEDEIIARAGCAGWLHFKLLSTKF